MFSAVLIGSPVPILLAVSPISKSKDGKWIIHRTTITDIKPVSYFEKVLEKSE